MAYDATSPSDPDPERAKKVRTIIEDGRTLTASEYRIIRCALHVGNGSHRWLSRVMGASRTGVSRTYHIACRRLVDAMGMRRVYLRRRGIEPEEQMLRPAPNPDAKLARRLLEGLPAVDVAWLLGVGSDAVYRIRHEELRG